MLRGEFTYTDATGTQRTCDLVAQELPAEGEAAPQRQSATQTATVCSRRSIPCNGSWRRPA
ncbi:MAG: hypothetical protein ACLSHL_03770 [Alistipes communis]